MPVGEVGEPRIRTDLRSVSQMPLMYTNGYSSRSHSFVLDAAAALVSGGRAYASYNLQ